MDFWSFGRQVLLVLRGEIPWGVNSAVPRGFSLFPRWQVKVFPREQTDVGCVLFGKRCCSVEGKRQEEAGERLFPPGSGCWVWALGRPPVGAAFASYIGNFQAAGWKNILFSGLGCAGRRGLWRVPKGTWGWQVSADIPGILPLSQGCLHSWETPGRIQAWWILWKWALGSSHPALGALWLCPWLCTVPCPAATPGKCLGAVGPPGEERHSINIYYCPSERESVEWQRVKQEVQGWQGVLAVGTHKSPCTTSTDPFQPPQ